MKGILFCLFSIVLLCSLRCRPEKENPKPYAPYDQRDQFVGVYSVQHDSGYIYIMRIEEMDSGGTKYLVVNNFANLFPRILANYNGIEIPLNFFNIGFNFGTKDKYNRTWDVGGGYDDTTTTAKENTLVGNQIVLYYRLQNMPWWSAEGVPYHYAFHKHIATKIY